MKGIQHELQSSGLTSREFATQMLPRVADGALSPVIDSRYPLADVASAHERMGANANAGKIVLQIG